MSLVLCVYEDQEIGDDIAGFQVGYGEFGAWRDFICARLEHGQWGSRFPTLMMHSDCDGEWSPQECDLLEQELRTIRGELEKLPVVPFHASWQQRVAQELGLVPKSALDCFINVDGENLVDAILRLADLATGLHKPISFM
jgi:hypothetical protein